MYGIAFLYTGSKIKVSKWWLEVVESLCWSGLRASRLEPVIVNCVSSGDIPKILLVIFNNKSSID